MLNIADKVLHFQQFSNAKHTYWGSRLINPKGRQLYNALISSGGQLGAVSPGKPTYCPTDPKKIPDLIDFAIIKGLTRLDHSPVVILLNGPVDNSQSTKKLTTQNTNWLIYKRFVGSHDLNPSLESNETGRDSCSKALYPISE